MSALEYHYNSGHKSQELSKSDNEQKESIEQIIQKLESEKCSYKTVTRKELQEILINDHDFVISAGGDGTVIATAAFNKNTPQLNIKTDKMSLGNLCCSSLETALEDFFRGNYTIKQWTRQDVYINEKLIGRALNETAVGEGMKFTKMARYKIELNESDGRHKKNEYHKNSGIIIATGTGSTGWPTAFASYPRSSKLFRFRTILPFNGSEKGLGEYFKIIYKGHEGKVALDTIEYDLPRDSVLEIKLSKNPLNVIKPR